MYVFLCSHICVEKGKKDGEGNRKQKEKNSLEELAFMIIVARSHCMPSAPLDPPESCNFVQIKCEDLRSRSTHIWSQEKMDVPT